MPRKRILIVEDEDDVRDTFADALSPFFDLLSVESGIAALHLLQEGVVFDLILSDVNMPSGGRSGIEIIRIARANELIPEHTKVMFMSAEGNAEIDAACVELRARFHQKPINPIVATVTKFLEE